MKAAICAVLLLLLLFIPDGSMEAARLALTTWGLDVVPSLFPYMVLCQSLSAQLSRTGGMRSGVVLLLGLLGGSPAGAAALSVFAQESMLDNRRILFLASACGTMSPMFFLGTIASWAGSASFGRMMLAAHLLGALLTALLSLFFLSRSSISFTSDEKQPALGGTFSPISKSVDAVLNVGGCIIFYSVVASAVTRLLPFLPDRWLAMLHALLESAGGVHAILRLPSGDAEKAVLCAAACGFSGLSILTQNHLFLKMQGVKMRYLLFFAALRGMCAAAVAMVFAFLFM